MGQGKRVPTPAPARPYHRRNDRWRRPRSPDQCQARHAGPHVAHRLCSPPDCLKAGKAGRVASAGTQLCGGSLPSARTVAAIAGMIVAGRMAPARCTGPHVAGTGTGASGMPANARRVMPGRTSPIPASGHHRRDDRCRGARCRGQGANRYPARIIRVERPRNRLVASYFMRVI
jgi:hypothetical protein